MSPGPDPDVDLPLLLGCDVGTSAVKSVLLDSEGTLLAHRVAEHPMARPRPDWAQNDPDDWYRGVAATVRGALADAAVDPRRVAAMSIVAQREPIVLTDSRGTPLAPAISWTDRRTEAEARAVVERFDREWLIETTGMAPIAGSSLTHLLWLREHEPDAWRNTRHILAAKDHVLRRLTGVVATDPSTPSRSLMYDVRHGDWSAEICDAFGIDIAMLAPIRERAWETVAALPAAVAEGLGLPVDLPIAMGGADDAAATLGAGAIDVGEICVGTGTATNWRSVLDEPRVDPEGRGDLAPHVVPGRYIFEVAIESTGSSLRWLRDTFADGPGFDALLAGAQDVDAGADSLYFFPYVDGAGRAPRYAAGLTGAFVGIVSGHRREHLVRALLEGVAFQYPPTMAIVSGGGAVRAPIATGDGEARNAVWNQIKADVLGVPLRVPRVVELAAVGAAILAGMAVGIFADAGAGVRSLVRWAEEFEPDPQRHTQYTSLRAQYDEIYELIAPALRRRGASPDQPTSDHEEFA